MRYKITLYKDYQCEKRYFEFDYLLSENTIQLILGEYVSEWHQLDFLRYVDGMNLFSIDLSGGKYYLKMKTEHCNVSEEEYF